MSKYFQGKYKCRNPSKYVGDPDNICYRSGWEFKVMMQLDDDPNVLQWMSEEMPVKYISPLDRKLHRYFPDFIVKKKTPQGIKVFMIEVKPLKDMKVSKTKNRKRRMKETITVAVNEAKWAAARAYCKRRGLIFQVLTEKELNIK